jgi:hypothetical protein
VLDEVRVSSNVDQARELVYMYQKQLMRQL